MIDIYKTLNIKRVTPFEAVSKYSLFKKTIREYDIKEEGILPVTRALESNTPDNRAMIKEINERIIHALFKYKHFSKEELLQKAGFAYSKMTIETLNDILMHTTDLSMTNIIVQMLARNRVSIEKNAAWLFTLLYLYGETGIPLNMKNGEWPRMSKTVAFLTF